MDALAYAAIKHAGQYRADGVTPYIRHPEAVVAILQRHGVVDPVVLAAAALHDVVEDCDVLCMEIQAQFGPYVAILVDWLTDRSIQRGERRLAAQIGRLRKAPRGAQIIKLADTLANAIDMRDAPSPDWSVAYVAGKLAGAAEKAHAFYDAHPAIAEEILALARKGA